VTESLASFIAKKARVLEEAGIKQGKAEVELILCHLLGVDRLWLYRDGRRLLTESALAKLDSIITRRVTRCPLQYILEEAWFYGRKFYVCPDVMIPTPETELLCETAISFVRSMKLVRPRILDLGVGSGVIAVTLAKELDSCSVLAVDYSLDAINVARRNAADLEVTGRIDFRQSDFFSLIAENELFDLILSNPPYISDGEYKSLPPEVLADPGVALLAGADGLDAIRVILSEAPNYLAECGRIMFEIGYRQAETVTKLTENDIRYQSIVIVKDLNDIDRLVILSCNK